jgi:hypothetical protein
MAELAVDALPADTGRKATCFLRAAVAAIRTYALDARQWRRRKGAYERGLDETQERSLSFQV